MPTEHPVQPRLFCATGLPPRPIFRTLAALLLGCLPAAVALGQDDTPATTAPPNILIILADDLGFSDIGCYGGEIETPHLDRLAAEGLRYTQFYNTARCWPTRSCLLSGYYPQQIRMDPPEGPLPAWTRLLPHYLHTAGYRCYQSGKWHVNGAPRVVADGGFDRSYKLDDHDRNFNPRKHTEDDRPLPPVEPDSGYYTTTFMADFAIRCLKEHAEKYPQRPFFQYLAFTVPHFPLQAPAADIAKYRDRYHAGWDTVRAARWNRLREMGITQGPLPPLETTFTPRYYKEGVLDILGPGEALHPLAWDALSDVQRAFQAAKMAVHAAMVDRMDQEIGRVLEQVRAMGALDNTLIVFLSDNGADATLLVRGDGHQSDAAPGSAESYLCMGPGWASASNAPFRRHKIWVHEGGISTPLIVRWPQGVAAHGDLRHAVGHVIDLVPTILELAGVTPTATWNATEAPPLPGRSLVPTFAADVPIPRDELFFCHEGNRALRAGNWKIVSAREDGDRWELYDLSTDRSETVDRAADQPQRVEAMVARWTALEAEFRRQAGPAPKPKQDAKR